MLVVVKVGGLLGGGSTAGVLAPPLSELTSSSELLPPVSDIVWGTSFFLEEGLLHNEYSVSARFIDFIPS